MASRNKTAVASEFIGRKHPLIHIWRSMHGRCKNKNKTDFQHYGGRGIQVTPEWNGFWDFVASIEKTIGARPSPLHSLDRVNVDGNYEPSNVRWATQKEQLRNQSRNVLIEFNGKTKCMSAWAEECGIPYDRLVRRLGKLQWPIEMALTAKKSSRKKSITKDKS